MASKESTEKSKTSKTARVMNLLSKKQEPAPAEEAAEAAAAGPVPPIISSLAPDATASVQIKNALESALEEELNGQPVAAPAGGGAESPAAFIPSAPPQGQKTPAPVQAAPSQEIPAQDTPVPVAGPDTAAAVPATPPQQPEEEEEGGYINVMQVLVEEKAEKYAKMFGLCVCQRCMADVKALALNHLPPKYVVMSPGDRIPKLTFYEGQYSSDITAQLLHACDIVAKRPHHTR